jgi:hypothetical protein
MPQWSFKSWLKLMPVNEVDKFLTLLNRRLLVSKNDNWILDLFDENLNLSIYILFRFIKQSLETVLDV